MASLASALDQTTLNTALLDLPLEVLTDVCQRLDLHDLVHLAETCKRFRHGDSGPATAELPTKSPVVSALRRHGWRTWPGACGSAAAGRRRPLRQGGATL
jgi:hypothetical protein